MQQATDFGYAVVSSRGGKNHVTRITGTWYGALAASAICGTTPAPRYGQHHGWVAGHLGSHETLAKAVQAAGGLVCSKCLKKAVQAEAEAEAALNEQLAALMTEADPETEAGQAWLAAQQAADSEQQAAARAAAAARAEALGITAEAIAEHQAARAARQAAWTEQAEQQQQQQAEEQPAETPAAPALAIALTAEALTDYPTVHTFAISAMVYLDDRGYAVERTIRRNIARADLLQAFSRLVGQPQLSRLAAYADGCG